MRYPRLGVAVFAERSHSDGTLRAKLQRWAGPTLCQVHTCQSDNPLFSIRVIVMQDAKCSLALNYRLLAFSVGEDESQEEEVPLRDSMVQPVPLSQHQERKPRDGEIKVVYPLKLRTRSGLAATQGNYLVVDITGPAFGEHL